MAYIGKTPVIGNFQKCDSISVVNGQAAYTLQVGGVNVSPQSENHMLVSLNGILQAPVDSFTVSGSTLTFASNLVTGDVIDFVMILGNVLDLGVPSDNTVSLAKLTATGTKDATTFLRGDNTFATVTSGLTEVDIWRYTSQTSSTGDITANLERDDSTGATYIGTGMTQSSGIFTFPSTGKYLIKANGTFYNDTGAEYYASIQIHVTTDNSSYTSVSYSQTNSMNTTGTTAYMNSNAMFLFDVTDTSNCKVKFTWNRSGHAKLIGSTNSNQTYFVFQKLGET